MIYIYLIFVLGLFFQLVFPLEVGLTLKETAGVGSASYPVTTVIPLPKGSFVDVNHFKIEDGQGGNVPAQFGILNKWWAEPVQSIRHVLVNFQPTVNAFSGSGTGTAQYFLKDNGSGNATGTGLSVSESGNEITVITGPLKFIVSKAAFNIIDQLWLDDNSNGVFEDSEKVIASHPQNGGVFVPRAGAGAVQYDATRPDVAVTVEESGPMRTVIRAEALTQYSSTISHVHGFAVRIYAYTGKPYVKIDYQLQNSAKVLYSWPLYFKEMNLDFRLNLSANPMVKVGRGDGTLYSRSRDNGVYLAQEQLDTFRIYDKMLGSILSSGTYTDGFMDVSDSRRGVFAKTRYFWQAWPNGLEIDSSNKLSVQLFPAWSRQWYANDAMVYQLTDMNLYWLQDMQHTCKEVLLYFHGSGASNTELTNLSKTFEHPPVAAVPTGWYKETRAAFDFYVPLDTPVSVTDKRAPLKTDYQEAPQLGWNWFLVSPGRKLYPSDAGGWPASGALFAATANPYDYFMAQEYAMGEINTKTQWLAGYTHETDWSTLRLTENPYASGSWKVFGDAYKNPPFDSAFLEGTSNDSKARDDEHAWFYHVEEAYYFSGNPWIKDWYRFVDEFRQVRLENKDPFPDMSSRAIGHPLSHALQAYRVTGDTGILGKVRNYLNVYVRKPWNTFKGQNVLYGFNEYDTDIGDAAFQAGYLVRPIIQFMEEIRNVNPQAYAEAFNYVSGTMQWNLHYSNFGYYKNPAYGVDSSSGTSFILCDPQAWYYWNTGKKEYLDQLNQYLAVGINGDRPYGEFSKWEGQFENRFTWFVNHTVRPDTVPPAAIGDLVAVIDTTTGYARLMWTAPDDARRYHVVWSNKPIVEPQTIDSSVCNWWAANAVGPALLAVPGTQQSVVFEVSDTLPFYAAIFSFDSVENMSAMSNSAQGILGQVDGIEETLESHLPMRLETNPNPFNPTVRISIRGLAQPKGVKPLSLVVYDVQGRRVADLSKVVKNGFVCWNAAMLPSGIYIIKAVAGNQEMNKTITLLK
ncbi:MAG: T9SS type A sorting domain-containing protein [Fibrobacterota bacterium]